MINSKRALIVFENLFVSYYPCLDSRGLIVHHAREDFFVLVEGSQRGGHPAVSARLEEWDFILICV